MFDISTAFPDDRFDLAYSTDRAARNRHETRIAALRVRKHIALTEQARNRVRSRLTAEPAPADAPSVRSALAAWDAHVAGARAHFAAQDEAYRLARLLPDHDGIESPSPVWRAMLNDLHDLNSPIEA
ncbi:hypothetical protein WK24_15240 [Burkholderia vietnamiensis]|jgi:hypothetical protein|uniref:hypothetical protein n=1 Tax=Burkholderia cepacia complex TaxID=87882 RepID=UPI000759B31B|nr:MULTISPECIES: hypothetical protein [Burkholderia cepacia complex]KVR67321.1 hypothetical protein WK24_15240 [Burkholderia vietnamiensis]MCA7919426.1 hypothetical protein [Burkholderia contaminans]UUX37170.1 hypothetical protein NTJ56_17795 [Burkholderia contaminans]